MFTLAFYENASEEHFRTCAHGRTYPHVRMWGAVRNFWNFYCAGGVRCGRVKKCHRTRTLIAGKIWENFLAFFQIFQKKCFRIPTHLFFEKISPQIPKIPHRTPHPHVRIGAAVCACAEMLFTSTNMILRSHGKI